MELSHLVKLVILIGDFSKYDNWSTCSESNWERNVGNESGSSYQNNLGKGIDKIESYMEITHE